MKLRPRNACAFRGFFMENTPHFSKAQSVQKPCKNLSFLCAEMRKCKNCPEFVDIRLRFD